MRGDDCIGASGIAAAETRPLTCETLASATPEVARKFLRDKLMTVSFDLIRISRSEFCGGVVGPAHATAVNRRLKINTREPEIALGFDRFDVGGDA